MMRIIGVGNALTDMVVPLSSDNVLEKFNLLKGGMSLVGTDSQRRILRSVAGLPQTLSLGGSAANTIRALAHLGVETGFIGEVGDDSTGEFFENALNNLSVKPFIFKGRNDSGRCLSLVSPDGERTMITCLGAAEEYSEKNVSKKLFEGYDCLYVEGYQVQNHRAISRTVEVAKECGLRIAMDLASYNVVEEHRDFLLSLVKEYVDIVFANQQEAVSFSGGMSVVDSLGFISSMCDIAVVKIGMQGAYIKRGEESIHVGIMAAAKRVDTTGAGDFYAAGFLAGLSSGLSLRQCGTLGAVTAGKVIEVVGTTFGEESWDDIFNKEEQIKREKYLF